MPEIRGDSNTPTLKDYIHRLWTYNDGLGNPYTADCSNLSNESLVSNQPGEEDSSCSRKHVSDQNLKKALTISAGRLKPDWSGEQAV